MQTKNTKIKENQFLIEPLRFVSALRQNAWIILLVSLVFAGIGISVAKMKESKSWKATAKLIRYDKKISNGSDIPYQFQNFNYETALETIRTRSNLVILIETLKLETTPEELYSKFDIKRGRNSDIIEVSYINEKRELSALGANTLSKIFIKNFYKTQNAAIEKIYEYYEISKDKKILELSSAKKAIANFLKANNLTSLKNELEIKYLQLNKVQLQELQNLTDINSYETTIQELKSSIKELPNEVKLKYAIRSANKKNLELKEKELKKLKKIYTTIHPKIKMLNSEITQLKDTIKNAKSASADETTYGANPLKTDMIAQLSRTQIAYITAKRTDKELKKQIEIIESRIIYLSGLNKNFEKLETAKEEASKQLSMVSSRLYDLKMAIGSSKEDFKMFEEAKTPTYPLASYKKLIVVMFSILGLFLSFVFILVKEFFNNSIKSSFDLCERFGIGDVVSLPKVEKYTDEIKQSFSYIVDSIISQEHTNSHLIVISSDSDRGMNKNTTSMILEQLAHQNKKTLFIESVTEVDEDIKDASFSINTQISAESFNTNPINDMIDKSYLILDKNHSIVIPRKDILSNILEFLKSLDYDYVIIKAPAYVNAEHLVHMMVEQCDTFLLETKFDVSTRKVLLHLAQQIGDKNIDKIKGVIHEANKYYMQ